MRSPVEGPRRTETSHFLIKSLELKCHVHIFLLFVYIYIYISKKENMYRKNIEKKIFSHIRHTRL